MKTKKLISILITLVMVVGMLPTMSLTAFAADRCLQKGGDGVYHIKDLSFTDLGTSWAGFYLDVKNGFTFEGETVSLDVNNLNISPDNGTYMIGSWAENNAKPFMGTFEGNGNTVNISYSDSSANDVGVFSHTNGADIQNLTVSGSVSGGMSVAGIVGNAYNTTFENCVNNATVYGSNIYIGGIAGWTGGGSQFLNCINNGEISGKNCVGGIIGYEGSAVSVQNCIAAGKVSATALAGTYPAEGDYMIYSSSGLCFGIQDGAEDLLQLWTASSSAAKVFTLTYDAQYDAYIITSKQSGLLLTAELGSVLLQDLVKVYQYQQRSDLPTLQRWKFVPDASGNCRIRPLAYDGWSMNVANGTEKEEGYIIAYKYGGNDLFKLVPEPNQTMNSVLAGGITGYHNSGSNYEHCFYNKDICNSNYGIGLSENAMKGISADTVGDKNYIMPDAINDYSKINYNKDDRVVYAYLNNNKQLAFHPAGWAYYLDDKGKKTEVANVRRITSEIQELTGGAYIVTGDVTVDHRLCIAGGYNVLIILADDSSLTVNGGIGLDRYIEIATADITIASQSFGQHMGKLTANGSDGCAGIGVGKNVGENFFTINIYGGDITATGGYGAAGIGTGFADGSSSNGCHSITITGGSVKATGGYGAAGIGTGHIHYQFEGHMNNVCDSIDITGGSITATGGENGAGIGSGYITFEGCDNLYRSISITGGSIIATADSYIEIERIGHGYDSGGGDVNYGEGITHERKGNSEWVNINYIPETSSCEEPGYKEAYYVPTSKMYYTAFPYNEDDLIGDETAYNIWKSEGGDGYTAPLGHSCIWKTTKFHTCTKDGEESYICKRCGKVTETRAIPAGHNYSYKGYYDTATEIYTLKKVCSACHEEAQEKALTYSVPKESYRSYLDVTNKAYINTGYMPTSNTHAVMDVEVNRNKEYWFGMWDEDYNKGAFALGNDGGNVYVGYGNDGGGCGSSAVSNGRHTVELNMDIAYIDGNALAGLFKPSDAFTLDYPLYLFAQNRKGTETSIPDNQKITCYGFQIMEGDNLLHYYIPYVKDKEAGLYDLIDGEFFGNSNTVGTMTAAYDDTFPETYTIAEYAEISGDTYFDTKLNPTKDTKVVMDVSVNGGMEYWFGVWDNDWNEKVFALGNDANNGGVYAGYGKQGGTDNGGAVSNGRHTIEMNKNKVYVDGIERTLIKYNYSSEGFPIENTLYLFAQNRSGNAFKADGQKITFYSCKIYDGDTLVRYYVPASGDITGKTVIYDAVTDEYLLYSGNGTVVSYGTGSLENILNVTTGDGSFTVTSIGKDAGNGTVVVALYADKTAQNLIAVKVFDLATQKAENIDFGDTDGYIKVYWWSDLDDIIPFSEAKELLWSEGKPVLIEK